MMGRWSAAWMLAACSLVAPAPGVGWADDWPSWGGPNHDGVSRETALPVRWSATENLAWRLTLPGLGGSTPAVWGERIFLTSDESDSIVLLCVSTAGKQLWKRKLGDAALRACSDEGNGASASPSTDGRHVWALAGTGDLACFDLDGKEVWRVDLQKRYGKVRYGCGMHTTPLLHGGRLYLQLLHADDQLVVALDAANGKEVWKVERGTAARGESRESYASLTIWGRGRDACLVSHGGDHTVGHRLDDGSELWRVVGLNPSDRYDPTLRFVASPRATADLLVIPTAKNGPVVALGPGATGEVGPGDAPERWRLRSGTPDVPSPLVYDGLVYLCREDGTLLCLDAKTGAEHYRRRTHNRPHRASPVCGDGKLYLTARDGTVTVVRAGPTFERLAVNKLPDVFAASPAIAGGRIYFRGAEALYAVAAGK